MIDVIIPKSNTPKKIVRALEIEEQQLLTNYLMNTSIQEEPFKVVYLLQMYLGLRIGEALALTTSDINLQKNLVYINKTLTVDENDRVIMGDTTKTYAGTREIPIPEFIKNEIIQQMLLAKNNKNKLLFVDSNGNYVNHTNANRQLKSILQKMGINDITTHSLRHTYGTRCVEAGMRNVALQRLMGHTDISTTLNTYTSVFNKYKESELEKVNNYYMHNEIVNPSNLTDKNIKLLENEKEQNFDER